MTMYTIKEVKSKVEQRQKMVNYLHAIVPELRKLATTLKLTRKSDGTLNKRDKDKLDAIIKAHQDNHSVSAYIKTEKHCIFLEARYSSISKSTVISSIDNEYYDKLEDYQAYTVEQVIEALKRKQQVQEEIRKLKSEESRLEIKFDLESYDFYQGE